MESTNSARGSIAAPVARMVSSCVSLSSSTSLAFSASRSARSFTWSGDSSPLTYSVVCPACCSRAATCSSSVDFPMPGSPPTSTMLPGTIPPPRTKSNSLIPVVQRRDSEPCTAPTRWVFATDPPSPRLAGPARRRAAPLETGAVIISSTSVFHSPHASQRPAHFGCSAPHSVQR